MIRVNGILVGNSVERAMSASVHIDYNTIELRLKIERKNLRLRKTLLEQKKGKKKK